MDILSLYVLTWNVAVQVPPSSEVLEKSLGLNPEKKDDVPDLFIIGLQEVSAKPTSLAHNVVYDDHWTQAYIEVLRKYDFVRVNTSNLLGIYLNVFCLKKHVGQLRDMGTDYKKTGAMGYWGNKGGVGFSLQINGCSLCFINSHLAAHEEKLEDRVRDYDSIMTSLKFHRKETSHVLFNDYIVWMGDLNFRLEGFEQDSTAPLNKAAIHKYIAEKNYSKLYEYDQLRIVRDQHRAFHEFSEKEIEFPPTFKLKENGSTYDDKRRSAWTDRILYRVNHSNYDEIKLQMEPLVYESKQDILLGDHRPVIARFNIKVFDNHVDRQVKFYFIENWILGKTNRIVMKIPPDWTISDQDWIGIYKKGFASLEDYVTYVYVANSIEKLEKRNLDTKVVIRFNDSLVSLPGTYQALYLHSMHQSVVSSIPKHVLGVSSPFEVIVDADNDIASQLFPSSLSLLLLRNYYSACILVHLTVTSYLLACSLNTVVCLFLERSTHTLLQGLFAL